MLQAMRFLVVEDDPAISGALLAALKRAGYSADACGTLAQAWAALTGEPFDAMLRDLGLPDGDGASLLARLRSAGRPSAVPRLVERIAAMRHARLVRDGGQAPMTTRYATVWSPDA